MLNNLPPGRGGQNSAQLPGRGGQDAPLPSQAKVPGSFPKQQQQQQQRVQTQIQVQPKLSIASFSRRNQRSQNVIVDLTSNNNNNNTIVNNSYSNGSNLQYTGERRVVKLTAEQERQQLRQLQDEQRLIEAARLKDREIQAAKSQSKAQKPNVTVEPYSFSFEQSMAFQRRNKLRNQMVDAVSLNIINRIFGNATVKVNGQIVPFVPGPVDLTLEPELLDAKNPNSYNFWITNVSSGLIKRLTGLVVRGMYVEELTSPYMALEMPKNGINLAIMVRDDRSLWGYITLLPEKDGLKYVLIYQLPIMLDWNDDGNEMKYQYNALNEAYNSLLNNMMLE